MKTLYPFTALLVALSFAGATSAIADTGKEGKHGGPFSYLDQTIAKLPTQDAAQFRATLKQAHEKNQALIEQVHALHDNIDTIVAAPTFDEQAFRAKSKELRDVYETMRANMDDAFATATSHLSQDERKTLATAMAYPHEKHKKDTQNAQ